MLCGERNLGGREGRGGLLGGSFFCGERGGAGNGERVRRDAVYPRIYARVSRGSARGAGMRG